MLRLRSGIKSLLCVKSGVHTSGMFREDIKALGKLRHFHTAIMYYALFWPYYTSFIWNTAFTWVYFMMFWMTLCLLRWYRRLCHSFEKIFFNTNSDISILELSFEISDYCWWKGEVSTISLLSGLFWKMISSNTLNVYAALQPMLIQKTSTFLCHGTIRGKYFENVKLKKNNHKHESQIAASSYCDFVPCQKW